MNHNLTQNKHIMLGLLLVVVMAIIAITPNSAKAETVATTSTEVVTSTSGEKDLTALLAILQDLMKQVEALQKQLSEVRGEIKDVRSELKEGLKEGMTHEDIRKIQELLATDPAIYPQGLVTGYYGPLTREALIRFQARHELRTTGEVDTETKALILEYFKERTGNKQIPPGLLRAPGIDKKIRERLKKDEDGIISVDCTIKYGDGFLCKYGDDKENTKKEKTEAERKKEIEEKEKKEEVVKEKKEDNDEAYKKAQEEIRSAELAVKKLDDAIDGLNNHESYRSLESDLEDAEAELRRAKRSLANGESRQAYNHAVKAKKIATEAMRKI